MVPIDWKVKKANPSDFTANNSSHGYLNPN